MRVWVKGELGSLQKALLQDNTQKSTMKMMKRWYLIICKHAYCSPLYGAIFERLKKQDPDEEKKVLWTILIAMKLWQESIWKYAFKYILSLLCSSFVNLF